MIIDFHTHCFPDSLAERAMGNLAKNSQYPPHYNGTVSGLKASMDAAGIDISLVLNIATNGHQMRKVNDFAISLVPDGRLIPFGSVHPDGENVFDETERLRAAGIKGIKFHPDYQGFFVDDKRMYPIYERIASSGLVMIFHCGHDLVLREPYRCPPERFANVVRDFDGAKIVGAHLGGQDMWDGVFEHLIGKNVWLDTSFGFKFMTIEQIRRVTQNHDNDRLLFATDAPWQDQKTEVEEMRGFIQDRELLQKIFCGNAVRLLAKNG